MTAAEVDEVVKDQLRLLIHLGYLDNLWNGNPDPNVGEGQWLFVERYSLRVAERLDALILETQNLGLIVDLLVALQIHSTALAALAGDADYAQAEVEPLADFLETMLGDNLPGSQGYRHAPPPFWWGSALAMGDYNPAVLSGYEPEVAPEAIAVAQEQAQERIKGLAYPLWFQGSGDPDPSNNQAEMIFHTAPPLLPPGVMDILNQVMGGSTPLEFVWEVLTGESENWWAIGGNIVLSFVPVAGELLDLLTLFTDPTIWGKAMSLIGLLASILSDGAEVLTAIGAVIPPTLAATVPGSVLLEALDVGAAILKNVRRLVSSATYEVIKSIPFEKALKLGSDVLGHLADRAVKAVGGVSQWPGSINEVFNLIQSVMSKVWDPFVALVTHYSDKLDDLFTLGFSDGGLLAGRVLSLSDEVASYTDEIIEDIAHIGDELGEAAADLSDEATEGLGSAVDSVGLERTKQLFSQCFVGATTNRYLPVKIAGHAKPLLALSDLCEESLEVYNVLKNDARLKRAMDELVNSAPHYLNILLQDVARGDLDQSQLENLLRVVDDLPPGRINNYNIDKFDRTLATGTLNGAAIKSLPYNSIDEIDRDFYERFDEYLINSTYFNNFGEEINERALAGQNIGGYKNNLVGEYRERRYLEYVYNIQNRNRIYDHLSGSNITDPLTQGNLTVNNPSLIDTITEKGGIYYIGEAKDGGGKLGTIQNGLKQTDDKFVPSTFKDFIFDTKEGHYFDIDRFIDQVNVLNIPASERAAIIRAAFKGDIVYEIFIGGGPQNELIGPKLLTLSSTGLRVANTRMGLSVLLD